MSRPKNVIRNTRKFKKKKKIALFNVAISSEAVFKLSPGAFKLYFFFIINGKKNEPSIPRFANLMNMSERTISRYYKELKDKGFIKLTQIGLNRYMYDFDINGNVDVVYEKRKPVTVETIKPPEEEVIVEPTEEVMEPIYEEEVTDDHTEYIEYAKTIVEYEDFAVLDNNFWTLPQTVKNEIISILIERQKSEPKIKDQLEWILNKIK